MLPPSVPSEGESPTNDPEISFSSEKRDTEPADEIGSLQSRIVLFDRRGIYTLLMIAQAFEVGHQYVKAEQCCRTALKAIHDIDRNAAWRCDVLADLASSLSHQGRYVEAEDALRQAYDLADCEALDLLTCWEIAKKLTVLLEVQRKTAESREWKQRADALLKVVVNEHFG